MTTTQHNLFGPPDIFPVRERLQDHIDLKTCPLWDIMGYAIMLMGAEESPLGPRRRQGKLEYEKHCGLLHTMASEIDLPKEIGWYMVEGDYEPDDFDMPIGPMIGFAWYEDGEWDVAVGAWHTVRAHHPMPWLPEVWQALVTRNAAAGRQTGAAFFEELIPVFEPVAKAE